MIRNAARLVIDGHVQGVGYRWWAVQTARKLGLAGWVCNRDDGAVEILAIGDEAAIGALAQACLTGPSGARVRSVVRSAAADDGGAGFTQLQAP